MLAVLIDPSGEITDLTTPHPEPPTLAARGAGASFWAVDPAGEFNPTASTLAHLHGALHDWDYLAGPIIVAPLTPLTHAFISGLPPAPVQPQNN